MLISRRLTGRHCAEQDLALESESTGYTPIAFQRSSFPRQVLVIFNQVALRGMCVHRGGPPHGF